METREKWEYTTIDMDIFRLVEGSVGEALTDLLNEHGAQGWELVAVVGGDLHRAFFKRRAA